MKHIIIGTDRVGSNSKRIAELVQGIYKAQGEDVELINLQTVMKGLVASPQYGNVTDPVLKEAVEKIEKSDGLIIVAPEYNGSMPGALKYFIDHLRYPDAFEVAPFVLSVSVECSVDCDLLSICSRFSATETRTFFQNGFSS